MTVKDKKVKPAKKDKKNQAESQFDFTRDVAINIDHMDLWYTQFHAIKDVSLEIKKGEITAFIGPSGCGKSTVLKSLNRMNDLVPGCRITGKIEIGGQDIYAPGVNLPMLRKNVGMVFQKPNPFPKSVYDNIAYAPRIFGIRDKKTLDGIVESSLRKAAMWDELKDRLNKSALGLSGGQQQRLCIARALAADPAILLMDEPTSALDPEYTVEVLDVVNELRAEGLDYIIVTHEMGFARHACECAAFLTKGRIAECGESEAFFSRPQSAELQRFLRRILEWNL